MDNSGIYHVFLVQALLTVHFFTNIFLNVLVEGCLLPPSPAAVDIPFI
jgi:hypothetical protein